MKLAICFLACTALIAQKDFLTTDEADQIRLAQDPNERVKIYIYFARQRVDLIEQALKREKAGRSGLIHDYLEEFTKIIEAIDIVTDDALKRKTMLDEGVLAIINGEKPLLEKLRAVVEAKPKDMARYEFALTQAIETTEDSIEIAMEDVGNRTATAAQREAAQRKELEELKKAVDPEAGTAPAPKSSNAAEPKPDEKATPGTDPAKPPRKPPTLRRKGETPPAKP